MFVEPESPETRTAVKTDPTATARSAIRRQRTVRRIPSAAVAESSDLAIPRPWSEYEHAAAGRGPNRNTLLEDIRRRGRHSATRVSSNARRNISQISNLASPSGNWIDGRVTPSFGGRATHRSRVEVTALEETHNRAPRRSTQTIDNTPPHNGPISLSAGPEAPDVQQSLVQPQLEPPHPESSAVYGADIAMEPALSRASVRLGERPPFTPGFAPAHRLSSLDTTLAYSQRVIEIADLSNQIRSLQVLQQTPEDADDLSAMLDLLSTMMAQSSMNLLPDYRTREIELVDSIRRHVESIRCTTSMALGQPHHMRELTNGGNYSRHRRAHDPAASLHRSDSDGLGDRQRSFSPEPVSWETMVTTITPDDQVPSTHTSFASTEASGSAAASSARSASTAPSTLQDIDPCPLPDIDASMPRSEQSLGVYEQSVTMTDHGLARDNLPHSNSHFNRVQSLARRLRHQRVQEEAVARHRRIVEREEELQRLERTLQRLERQLEDERDIDR